MTVADLDTMLLDGWADLDAAGKRADAIEEMVFEAINRRAESWAEERGWSGIFNGPDELWIAPPAWTTSTGGRRPGADAWFQLSDKGAEEDCWWLTSLMGLGQGRLFFKFRQTRIVNKAWVAIAKEAGNAAALPQFTVDDSPSFILPFRVDRDLIRPAVQGDGLQGVLDRLEAALQQLESAVPIIDPWLGPRAKAD
jgi:hypothetical protein